MCVGVVCEQLQIHQIFNTLVYYGTYFFLYVKYSVFITFCLVHFNDSIFHLPIEEGSGRE